MSCEPVNFHGPHMSYFLCAFYNHEVSAQSGMNELINKFKKKRKEKIPKGGLNRSNALVLQDLMHVLHHTEIQVVNFDFLIRRIVGV